MTHKKKSAMLHRPPALGIRRLQYGQESDQQDKAGGGKGPITEDEAKDYLKRAGGDKDKARALAKADNRTF